MDLWTDYEGKTIAGAYRLIKLLRSEGRNGFFSTSRREGDAAVIRLTEAHFDEEEQLERWRHVKQIQQENLITIDRMGQTAVDGVTLTYAVMEREDENLEEILKERPLTAAETLQVGRSVGAALAALHEGGLVHQHINPANVLAVGQLIKLRSDCVRDVVENAEFDTPEKLDELRQRDVHDFGTLLLRCLTLESEWRASLRLPDPFPQVIPQALDGSLTLSQILARLEPVAERNVPTVPAYAQPSPTVPAYTQPSPAAQRAPAKDLPKAAAPLFEPAAARLPQRRLEPEDNGTPFHPRWIAYGVAALLVLALLWHFLGSSRPKSQVSQTQPAAPLTSQAPAPRGTRPAASADMAPSLQTPASRRVAPAEHRSGYYVIAYTYNHEEQARAKAGRISRKHPALRPEVFSPSGHAPYLVSLGGAMGEESATAVLRSARRSGMPRDTFVRRY